MKNRWMIAVMALPVPVAVLIPTALMFLFRASRWAHSPPTLSNPTSWLGAAVGILGVALAVWSVSAFARFGDGTPAPWDPPARFVARGPYCFVRNPMILGVFFVLLGEALLLRSVPLFIWFVLFVAGNALYIPLVEEKGLARRFGAAYLRYKDQVPRWLPRGTAWHPGDETM